MNACKIIFSAGAIASLVACTQRMSIKDLNAMPPQRPEALELLNAFVGHWEWKGQGTVAGLEGMLSFSGLRDSQWEGNGWYLVTREVGTMEGFGETRTLTIWSYDKRAGCFRTAYVDSAGTTTIGTARFNDETTAWHLRAVNHGPSGTTSARGQVRFLDPDRMEWTWSEYGAVGLRKTMELSGVCYRKP